MGDEEGSAIIRQALAGQPEAARALVDRLYGVVQARIARVLLRGGRGHDGRARQDLEDMVQEVFAFLFAQQGKVLRAWEPERGLSLANFVGLVAERHAVSLLRGGRLRPWSYDPLSPSDEADVPDVAQTAIEPRVLSRALLEAMLDGLRERLSPLGMHLFQLLFVEERSVEDIAGVTGMTADAIYAWRSRLRKIANDLLSALDPRTPVPVPLENAGTTPGTRRIS